LIVHEWSIVESLLARAADEARARPRAKVMKLHVKIGELSGVERDLLSAAFETFRARTPCAEATLEIEPVAAAWRCRSCGREIEPGRRLRCDACGSPARLVQGDEIVLERIEMEVPDV
jgi:hydrogenase nickel incorporation protein HypA/HybF